MLLAVAVVTVVAEWLMCRWVTCLCSTSNVDAKEVHGNPCLHTQSMELLHATLAISSGGRTTSRHAFLASWLGSDRTMHTHACTVYTIQYAW
jgi:hypothetical protein